MAFSPSLIDGVRQAMEQQVVLVTGSTRGIGLGIAAKLVSMGLRVVINGRDKTQLEKASSSLPDAFPVCKDVTLETDAAELISMTLEHFGRIDHVVCNVGSGKSVKPGEETLQEWQRVFALNLWSATNVVEAATSALKESKGSIVCISSICGLAPIKGAPVTYSAAKSALNAYVKSISRHLGMFDVRINAIALGNIFFEGSTWQKKLEANEEEVQFMLKNGVALQKFGTTEDVANLVKFLISSDSSFATGSIWTLDGGQI